MPCGNTRAIACPDYVNGKLGPYARRVTRNGHAHQRAVAALIRCANALAFAVRVGESYACRPRSRRGPWETVEVIGLNRPLTDLRRYRDDAGSEIVYREVPVDLLNRVIARNGGPA